MDNISKSKKKLTLSLLVKIIMDMVRGFMDDSVLRLSASLAYATLFSIIPFLSLLITIGVFIHMDLTHQLYVQLEPILGKEVVETLRGIIENAARTDSSAFASIVSLGVSIFGATTIFAEIQSSLNTIWGIKAVPKKSWLKYLKNRLLSFSIILIFAFILLVTFAIQYYFGTQRTFHQQLSGRGEVAGQDSRRFIEYRCDHYYIYTNIQDVAGCKNKKQGYLYRRIRNDLAPVGGTVGNIALYRNCKCRNRLRSGCIHGRDHHLDLLFRHHYLYRRRVHQSVGQRNGWKNFS